MPTVNQLIRKGRRGARKKTTAPAFRIIYNALKNRTGQGRSPQKRGGVHPGEDGDAEEAQFCAAQGGSGAADQWD